MEEYLALLSGIQYNFGASKILKIWGSGETGEHIIKKWAGSGYNLLNLWVMLDRVNKDIFLEYYLK